MFAKNLMSLFRVEQHVSMFAIGFTVAHTISKNWVSFCSFASSFDEKPHACAPFAQMCNRNEKTSVNCVCTRTHTTATSKKCHPKLWMRKEDYITRQRTLNLFISVQFIYFIAVDNQDGGCLMWLSLRNWQRKAMKRTSRSLTTTTMTIHDLRLHKHTLTHTLSCTTMHDTMICCHEKW